MQLYITLTSYDKLRLPIHYSLYLQAVVYHLIDQPALRNFLHEQGFLLEKRSFKLFTFSRWTGRSFELDKTNHTIVFEPPYQFVICSPVPTLIEEIGKGLLKKGEIKIIDQKVHVQSLATVDTRVVDRSIEVEMMSPVTVYSTIEQSDGRRFTYYYTPFEERFNALIHHNLLKKYKIVSGRSEDDLSFKITPLRIKKSDQKIVQYHGFSIKGWMGRYRLEGDPLLLELALSAGIGSKNSQGFGCAKRVV